MINFSGININIRLPAILGFTARVLTHSEIWKTHSKSQRIIMASDQQWHSHGLTTKYGGNCKRRRERENERQLLDGSKILESQGWYRQMLWGLSSVFSHHAPIFWPQAGFCFKSFYHDLATDISWLFLFASQFQYSTRYPLVKLT